MDGTKRRPRWVAVAGLCCVIFGMAPAGAEAKPPAISVEAGELAGRQLDFARAEKLIRDGQWDEALAVYQRLLEVDARDDAAAAGAIAVIDHAPAAERPGRLLALRDRVGPVPLVSAQLALVYVDQGRLDDALRSMGEAVESAPDQPIYRLNLGILADRLGDRPAAIQAYQQFFALYRADAVPLTVPLESVRRRLDYLLSDSW